MVLGEMGQIVY